MASRALTWRHIHKQLSTNAARDSSPSFVYTGSEYKCQTSRYRFRLSLLLFLLLGWIPTLPLLAASPSSINYGSLTWGKWRDIYASAVTDPNKLSTIYCSGPRVRAKIMVATHISMDELQASEAIFRQHVGEIVRVETIERVVIEYVQTDTYSKTERGKYYVALGISALPPSHSSDTVYSSSSSALLLPAIETERERIVERLRFGNILTTGNVTINSLSLFGVPMRLVEVVMDGETFVQLDLKPWVGVQLVIASSMAATMGTSSSGISHYVTDRDAFQDLSLRFLLAQRLQSLRVRVSDILVHSPINLLPFATYHASAGVLELEIHVHDVQYADFVQMYLLSDHKAMPNNTLADSFNTMEPEWQLLAMDIDTNAGARYTPLIPSHSASSNSSKIASELKFKMHNVSLVHLEHSKWNVLDCVQNFVADVVPSRVRFGRIRFSPSSSLAMRNDDNADDAAHDHVLADSIFDPINAINWTLSFEVEPETTTAFDGAAFADHIASIRNSVEVGLQHALGLTEGIANSSSRSVTFQGTSDWTDLELGDMNVVEPFVLLTLTIQVKPLAAFGTILESPNFFQLHYIRSALVLLLQQVAVVNDHVAYISTNVVDQATVRLDKSEASWHHLLLVKYRVTISDESQRRGVRSVVFSPRLASIISMYSGRTLELIQREVDLHADGSPTWPRLLPGTFVIRSDAHNISDGFVTSTKSLRRYHESVMYEFNDPEPSATSGTLQNASDVCSQGGASSFNSSGLCFRLRFTGTAQATFVFLRSLQSFYPITSSSLSLPPAHAPLDTLHLNSTYPAPWVLLDNQSDNGETFWTLFVDRSSSSFKAESIRLTFEAVDTMQNLSRPTPFTIDLELIRGKFAVLRRHFGDFALLAASKYLAPAFLTADLPEFMNNGTEPSDISVTLKFQEPRLGGLYSLTLLNDVAPGCSTCTALLMDCHSNLECRAFSACTSVLFDADLTLMATMLQNDAPGTSVDVSWLLKSCLSPSDGTIWSNAIREILVLSYSCLWRNHCPLAYSEPFNRQLVLQHDHSEQVLVFQLVRGFASLSFTLPIRDDAPTFEFRQDFSVNATDVTAQLDTMLTLMYRTARSNVATVKSTLFTTKDAGTDVVTSHLTISYEFLGRFMLPLVEITHSGSSDASVNVTVPTETLHLRVVPIT